MFCWVGEKDFEGDSGRPEVTSLVSAGVGLCIKLSSRLAANFDFKIVGDFNGLVIACAYCDGAARAGDDVLEEPWWTPGGEEGDITRSSKSGLPYALPSPSDSTEPAKVAANESGVLPDARLEIARSVAFPCRTNFAAASAQPGKSDKSWGA